MAAAGAEPAVEARGAPGELGGGERLGGAGGERERCGLACAALVVHALDVDRCRGVASVGQAQAAFGVGGAGREHRHDVAVGGDPGRRVVRGRDRAAGAADVGEDVEIQLRADRHAAVAGRCAEALREALGGVAELEVGCGEGDCRIRVESQREGFLGRSARPVQRCRAGAWGAVGDAEQGLAGRGGRQPCRLGILGTRQADRRACGGKAFCLPLRAVRRATGRKAPVGASPDYS